MVSITEGHKKISFAGIAWLARLYFRGWLKEFINKTTKT
jgi:hypothetical protein